MTLYFKDVITFDFMVRNIIVFIGFHMMITPLMILASREVEIPYGKIKRIIEYFTIAVSFIQAIMWIYSFLLSIL